MNISINKKIQKIQIKKKKKSNYPYSFLQFPKYFSKSLKLSPNIASFFFGLGIWGSLMIIHTKSLFDEKVLNVVRI